MNFQSAGACGGGESYANKRARGAQTELLEQFVKANTGGVTKKERKKRLDAIGLRGSDSSVLAAFCFSEQEG